MIPSCEQVLSYFLRNHASITPLVSDHVYTTTPKSPTEKMPYLLVTRIGGSPVTSVPLFIDQAVIQFDCYGGNKFASETLAHTAREVLTTDFPGFQTGSGSDAVITAVDIGAMFYLPDQALEPPKPRYLFDATITLHPAY